MAKQKSSKKSFVSTVPEWVKPGVVVELSEKAVVECDVILVLEKHQHSTLQASFEDERNPSPVYRSKENKSLAYLVLAVEAVENYEVDGENLILADGETNTVQPWFVFMRLLNSDGQIMVMGVRPIILEGSIKHPYGAQTKGIFNRVTHKSINKS